MTMKQVIRALEKSARAADREAARAQRESQRRAVEAYEAAVKQQHYAHAASSVAAYQNYVKALVTYHHLGHRGIDWHAVMNSAPPPAPVPNHDGERAALAALQGFKPALADRILGRVEAKRAKLEHGVSNARNWDANMFQGAQTAHAESYAQWQHHRELAQRVINRDASIYSDVLDAYQIPSAFESIGTHVMLDVVEPNLVSFAARSRPGDTIPQQELKLTKTGKVSTRQLAKGRYWELMQDHLCSCAIRLACDTFNALLVDRVIVNIGEGRINSVTGHHELSTLVGVHFTRDAIARINVYNIDPSDSLANFNCRMKFRKTKGFDPVEPVTPEDQWVTAG